MTGHGIALAGLVEEGRVKRKRKQRICSIQKVLRFAVGTLEAAEKARRHARTCELRLRHDTKVMRVSMLLTYWHGQEATDAPRSNVGQLRSKGSD